VGANQTDNQPRSISFSPDSRWLALSGAGLSIMVFDVQTRKLAHLLEAHSYLISTLVFFADSTRLISGGFDGKLCVWSVPDFKLIRAVQHGTENQVENGDRIVSIAIGAEDDLVVVGFMSGSVGMYEPTFSQPMSSFSAHQELLLNVAVSPQGMIATASQDCTAKLWTLRGVASCRQTLKGHSDYVVAVRFSPNDPVVFTGSKDESIKCWSTKDGNCWFTLKGHKNTLFQIDHHPTDKSIVACSGDGLVCMWDYSLP
jgi:WD40 repeat protein